MEIKDVFTSTGAKFFAHQEAMTNLKNGKGQPIVTHIMLTDVCNHKCAFCSVQARAGDSLPYNHIVGYVEKLLKYGLKAVILSGGGNPILYKDSEAGKDFNDVVDFLHSKGLEIGLITNGAPVRQFSFRNGRKSWKMVFPKTLDKLTWIRISMSGLDHDENEVYVPDLNQSKTVLGFSYVAHDIYKEPKDPYHGKVSRPLDILSGNLDRKPERPFEDRIEQLTNQIGYYVYKYSPRYVRLLPNCLEPPKIEDRCKTLNKMADCINENFANNKKVAFVQYKPPAPPKACYLGYIHPVLNCDGYVYPCDSCVLNEKAGHSFSNPWRICKWDEIESVYETPISSLIKDPSKTCPGCVFTNSNELLYDVVHNLVDINLLKPKSEPEHVNFV